MQAGLCWITVLSLYDEKAIDEVTKNEGIIYTPMIAHWKSVEDAPATTPLSDQISKDLKKMGFKFVGSTIIYAFMQATDIVNDHISDCFDYQEMKKSF